MRECWLCEGEGRYSIPEDRGRRSTICGLCGGKGEYEPLSKQLEVSADGINGLPHHVPPDMLPHVARLALLARVLEKDFDPGQQLLEKVG